jgi:putative Holliday junction resolvase
MTNNSKNNKNNANPPATGNPQQLSPIVTIEQLADSLVIGHPLMGLDSGSKTIGIAISDSLHNIATPLKTVRRSKFNADAKQIVEVIEDYHCGGIILGLPLNMDGSEGPRVQSARAFARNLSPLANLPICFWDERLSTIAVERTLLEADASRKRRSEVIDKMAAGYILQGALDRISQLKAVAE